MRIKDRKEFSQKPAPLTCTVDETVLSAVKRMTDKNYGSVIVVDDADKVLGMVTERDIFRRLVSVELDPATTTVRQIMTAPVRTASANDDLLPWLRMMSNERFRRLPIVDENGTLVSIMSQGDFVSYTWPELMGRVGEMAKATISAQATPMTMMAGVVIYIAVAVTAVLAYFLSRMF